MQLSWDVAHLGMGWDVALLGCSSVGDGVGCSSGGRALYWHAANTGSIPQCSNTVVKSLGFFQCKKCILLIMLKFYSC